MTAPAPRYSLIPSSALRQVASAFAYGAEKHKDDDYVSTSSNRTISGEFDAVIRHYRAFVGGERNDAETGLHHLAHAAARALIACQMALEGRR